VRSVRVYGNAEQNSIQQTFSTSGSIRTSTLPSVVRALQLQQRGHLYAGNLPHNHGGRQDDQPNGNIATFAGPATDLAFNFQLNYTHVFSPNLLLNLVTSYLRVDNQSYPLNHGSNATAAFGFPGVNTGGTDVSGLTPISFPGYGALGDGIALPLDYDPRQLPASRSLIDSNGTRARDQRP
jgi:hypothetical protein